MNLVAVVRIFTLSLRSCSDDFILGSPNYAGMIIVHFFEGFACFDATRAGVELSMKNGADATFFGEMTALLSSKRLSNGKFGGLGLLQSAGLPLNVLNINQL